MLVDAGIEWATTGPLSYLWAKTGGADQWHPLGAHMVDAANVAQQLWDSWLAPATRRWLAVPLGGDSAARAYFSWLAGSHDLGKASPAFQVQVPSLAARLRDAGMPLPSVLPERERAPHAKVSAVAIGHLLSTRFGWNRKQVQGPAAILGGHHGWFPQEGLAREAARRPALYGWSEDPEDPWMAARATLFDLVVALSGAHDVLAQGGETNLGRARELALAGYVILADWLASNEELFPYSSAPFHPGYVVSAGRRATGALDAVGWRSWDPQGQVLDFPRRFGFPPNSLQREVISVINKTTDPGLLLIEAPMGIGKTEAALAATEILAASHGLGGTFIALPTQATSNQMFSRARRWLEHMGPGTYVMELAHGKARQVAEYQALHSSPTSIDVDEDPVGHVTAEAWFAGSKKRLLAPFVVGTVDQALLCAAKVKHVALRQVGLQGKVVVIDEVHAYDAHMSVFLRRALRWLGEARIPVVLLSATLSPGARRRLVEAYTGGPVALTDIGYPSVTSVGATGQPTSTRVPLDQPSRQVKLQVVDEDTGEALLDTVTDMARRGANVLIVRNTVARAQVTARALVDALGPEAVTVLHARFLAADRLTKERWLSEHFGPGGERPTGQVVVGTQVLEQSLDVDFDALVTDLAPVDLVLQRVGRTHRHPGIRRPPGFEAPLIVLCGLTRHSDGPLFPRGSRAVYGEHLLLRTAAVLFERGTLTLPDDMPTVVERVYGDDDIVPVAWAERAIAAAETWRTEQTSAESRATQFAIPAPDGAPNLFELCRIGLGDPDDDDPVIQAAVRDAPATLEVVVGRATSSASEVTCREGIVPLTRRPRPEEVDRALGAVLRLPPWVTTSAITALEVPAGWRDHPWLRNHRLLRLGDANNATIGNNVLAYSSALGLEVTSDGG